MKLIEDLKNIGASYSCSNCKNKNICPKNYTCIDFEPENRDEFLDRMIKWLRENNIPSNQRRLKRYSRMSSNVGLTRDTETLDTYYVQLINDVLSQIRKGNTGYVFTLEQIKDVLRFEPNAEIVVGEGDFRISLPSKNKLQKEK